MMSRGRLLNSATERPPSNQDAESEFECNVKNTNVDIDIDTDTDIMTATNQRQRSHKKSRELPKNSKLVKRRLPRPLPPARLSTDPKTVYVSTKSPFVSTVKRVRKALTVFKDQSKVSIASGGRQKRAFQRRQGQLGHNEAGLSTSTSATDDKMKYVTIKASGKAIEKALGLGLYFQGQKDTSVEIRTGTVEATDDVEADQSHLTFEDLMKAKERTERKSGSSKGPGGDDTMDVDDDNDSTGEFDEFEEVDDVFPSRTRNISVIEVIVRNKAPT
ncbi:hypothetical protein TWF718_000646 [Orbilia javanica]|uniref:Uncharacterized protein n=1 Tax=Orbilia javanica TaxID=47235 RepID=A0AAN8RM53_9PEZI